MWSISSIMLRCIMPRRAYSPSAGEAAGVAAGVVVVGRHRHPVGQQGRGLGRSGQADGVVGLRPGAPLRRPERAGGEELPGVDGGADGARIEADAAQRVVELVAEEHAAHAERVQLVEAAVDVLLVALGDVEDLLAAEGFGRLHAEHHGEPALPDDVAGLLRVGDDAEPAFARAAVHAVDVVLELVGLPRLEADGGHLVAAAVLVRVERAQQAVGDEVVDEDALAAAPGTLDPRVVVLLVAQRVVGRQSRKVGQPTGSWWPSAPPVTFSKSARAPSG